MTQLIKNGNVITEGDFLSLFPNKSFPSPIPYDKFGWKVVFPAPKPVHNEMTQAVREIAPALSVLDTWEQQWEIVELDVETIASLAAQKIERENEVIKKELLDIDLKSIRALREGNAAKILEHENAAKAARAKLK